MVLFKEIIASVKIQATLWMVPISQFNNTFNKILLCPNMIS